MYGATNEIMGTSYSSRIDDDFYQFAGKTGTAQVCSNCDLLPHAWFAGFIELDNKKKYSISIIIENGGKGSNIPAIMARKIFEFIVSEDV